MLQIAQVLKSNGTDGELVLSFREIAPEDINLQEPVFIIFDGLPVPFFIDSFQKRGNSKALVHLTDISTQEDVEEIVGKAVYIEDDSSAELSLEDDGYAALVGWTLLTLAPSPDDDQDSNEGNDDQDSNDGNDDQDSNEDPDGNEGNDDYEHNKDKVDLQDSDDGMILYEVGEITDFIDIPNNPCIEVETENGAVMIPLHEDLIISVDPENQELIMEIPEGLL